MLRIGDEVPYMLKYNGNDVRRVCKGNSEIWAVKSSNGENIEISDSANTRFRNFKIFGKSTQNGTPSPGAPADISVTGENANLLSLPDTKIIELNGVSWNCKNGRVYAVGTAGAVSSSESAGISNTFVGLVGKYYVGGNRNNVYCYARVTKSDGTTEYYNNSYFELDGAEKNVVIYCQVQSGVTVDTLAYPLFCAGTESIQYKPIECKISTNGNQMFTASNDTADWVLIGESNGSTLNVSDDLSQIIVTGKTAWTQAHPTTHIPAVDVIAGETYWFYCDILGGRNAFVSLQWRDENGSNVSTSSYSNTNSGLPKSFVCPDGASALRVIFVAVNSNNDLTEPVTATFSNFIMSKTKTTRWEPYQYYKMVISNVNGLAGVAIPESSSLTANYVDENGQKWVCDEIDLGRRERIQRINRVKIDNYTHISRSQMPSGSGLYRYNMFFNANPTFLPAAHATFGVMCNALEISGYPLGSNEKNNVICAYQNGGLFVRYDDATTSAEFKQFATSVGLEIQYILAEPIVTTLIDDEIAAYKSILTANGNTTISNSANAFMMVEYISE